MRHATVSVQILLGFAESKTSDSVELSWNQWPPLVVGLILIPWLIGWSIGTLQVWFSYIYNDATHSQWGTPASLFDVLGFTFFWLFGFAVFCILYLQKLQFHFDKEKFERKNGYGILYFQTSAQVDAIEQVRHSTEDMQVTNPRRRKTIDYIEIVGTLNRAVYLRCFGVQIRLINRNQRSYEMLIEDRALASYILEFFLASRYSFEVGCQEL